MKNTRSDSDDQNWFRKYFFLFNFKFMKPSKKCYEFIRKWEGCVSPAEPDMGGVPTIGYGTIAYPDGTPVKRGETCTEEQAVEWCSFEINQKGVQVDALTRTVELTQNQFDMLVSFAYNEGVGALESSTLLRKVLADPNDSSIYDYDPAKPVYSCEFLKWVYVNGRVVRGLVNRRMDEADTYRD
jgi:lysozyme